MILAYWMEFFSVELQTHGSKLNSEKSEADIQWLAYLARVWRVLRVEILLSAKRAATHCLEVMVNSKSVARFHYALDEIAT